MNTPHSIPVLIPVVALLATVVSLIAPRILDWRKAATLEREMRIIEAQDREIHAAFHEHLPGIYALAGALTRETPPVDERELARREKAARDAEDLVDFDRRLFGQEVTR